MIPRSRADTTAAVRSSTPSLAKMCSRAPGPLQVAAGHVRAGRQFALGGLELQHDADEALGQGVVEVAGQALALRQPARLPLGGGQFVQGQQQREIGRELRMASIRHQIVGGYKNPNATG